MNTNAYIRNENWSGSYFELALELGPAGDDAQARRAVSALWRHSALVGPWQRKEAFGARPTAAVPGVAPLYGCLSLPDGNELGCLSWFIRDEPGSDWLDLSIPLGMLEATFAVAHPIDRATNPWIATLESTLVAIAASVFAEAPFRLGLLGEEASGAYAASELTAERCEIGGLLVPSATWEAHAPKRVPSIAAPGLLFAPYVGPHITIGG